MNIQDFTKRVQQKENLPYDDMVQAVELIFNEETPKEDIADFLVALNKKGEYGAYSTRKGFEFGVYDNAGTSLKKAIFLE